MLAGAPGTRCFGPGAGATVVPVIATTLCATVVVNATVIAMPPTMNVAIDIVMGAF